MPARLAFILWALVLATMGTLVSAAAPPAGQTNPKESTLKPFQPPATDLAWRGEPIRVSLFVGGARATNVRLVQSLLREQDSFETLDFQLCRDPVEPCREIGPLEAGQAHHLYLRPLGSVSPGDYAGTFIISSSEKPDGVNLPVSLHHTTSWRLLLGAVAILVGVVVYWLVMVVARSRIARKELQRALALLQARVEALRSAADTAYPSSLGIDLATFRQALAEAERGLSEAATRLPSALPWPGQGQWPDSEWFRGEVTRLDGVLDGLEAIMGHGLQPAARLLAARPGDDRVLAAITSIDARAAEAGTQALADLIAAIRTIIANARTAGPKMMHGSAPDAGGVALVRKLDFEISLLGAASWWVILVVTVLVGILVMLLPNKGFGQWQDYIACLLWGFGLPVTTGQLASLNTESVRTAFSLTRQG